MVVISAKLSALFVSFWSLKTLHLPHSHPSFSSSGETLLLFGQQAASFVCFHFLYFQSPKRMRNYRLGVLNSIFIRGPMSIMLFYRGPPYFVYMRDCKLSGEKNCTFPCLCEHQHASQSLMRLCPRPEVANWKSWEDSHLSFGPTGEEITVILTNIVLFY